MFKAAILNRWSIGVLVLLGILVSAGHAVSATEDEKNNIAVYEKVADGVVNVTSTAVQWISFFIMWYS